MESSRRKLRHTTTRDTNPEKQKANTGDSTSQSEKPAKDIKSTSRAIESPAAENHNKDTVESTTQDSSTTAEQKQRSPAPSPPPSTKRVDDRTFQQLVEDYDCDSKFSRTFSARRLLSSRSLGGGAFVTGS